MHSATGSPHATATVVRFREGWGMLAGAVAVCGFVAPFLYFVLHPDEILRGSVFTPWLVVIVVGPLALLFLAVALYLVSCPQRVYVDGRGLWFKEWGEPTLLAWSELRGLRGQEPVPKRKDDPEAQAVPAALVFYPVDADFAERHPGLLDRRAPEGCHRKLIRRGVVRRIVDAVADRRPDLLH